jgi:hypothetical protein
MLIIELLKTVNMWPNFALAADTNFACRRFLFL